MKNTRKCWLTAIFLVLAALSGLAVAQHMEVLELRSRTVDEVLPTLLPLVEPGGTLTGVNNQLFLRASPRNREEIRRALAAIDKPARRLIIRVAHERQQQSAERGGEARVWDSRSQRRDNAAQMVQTVDGSPAFIQVGRVLALPMRQVVVGPHGTIVSDTVSYQDVGSGFYATPRVNGERVRVEISQHSTQIDRHIETQRLMTTVEGQVGAWLELGGTGQQVSARQDDGFSVGSRQLREQRSLWLKVDTVD